MTLPRASLYIRGGVVGVHARVGCADHGADGGNEAASGGGSEAARARWRAGVDVTDWGEAR